MKKVSLIIAALLLGFAMSAQNKKFVAGMKKALAQFDSVKKTEQYQGIANDFERIGNAEKKEWLPNYYAGMCYIMLAFDAAGDKIDTYCDKAEVFLRKADSLSPNNSEIYVLKSMLASARISVNPMQRGMQYGMESGNMIQKAVSLNPKNPRAHLQKGTSAFYTPEMYGGGKNVAKPDLQKAVDAFKEFKAESEIHPGWGHKPPENLLAECNKS
jgi:hypothetical protein